MTDRMKAALGLSLGFGTLASTMTLVAQEPLNTTTKTVKVAPGETKTTIVTKEGGAGSKATKTTVTTTEVGGRKRVHGRAMKHEKVESAMSRELREMREIQASQDARIANQQAQIDLLIKAGAAKDAALAQAQMDTQNSNTAAQAALAQAKSNSTQEMQDVQTINATVATLQTKDLAIEKTVTTVKAEVESPLSIRYKNLKLTPGGFVAMEGVYRTRSINSDIVTPFNNTPYPGANEGHISELNFSARQTRPSIFVEGSAGKVKLSGFLETDFLSSGTTSNNNQTDSYVLRFRQVWGKAELPNGFAATFGQTWTLLTENGKGTDAKTEKLPNVIDPSYIVGYSYARQPALRLQQKFANNAFTVAMSIEQAQTQLTATNAPANFIFGGTGTSGGVYNAFNGVYANNVAPDVLVKAAYDTKHSHLELGGIARFFRDEYYPLITSATGATTAYSANLQKSTRTGGGVFGSFRVSPSKFIDVAIQGMAGDGTGRYGAAQLGDVTAKPDGTLEPLRNYHGLFSLETHPTKKLDVYAYFGAEYNQREVYINKTGGLVGYGLPNANDTGCNSITPPAVGTGTGVTGSPTIATCASNTRDLQEGMIGYTYKMVSDPKFGILRFQMTYSYLEKYGWAGIGAGTYPAVSVPFSTGAINYYPAGPTYITPRATNNLMHMSLRYYLP